MTTKIHCDGGTWGPGGVACEEPVTLECLCRRCQFEKPDERFYSCPKHVAEVSAKHERVRGRRAELC